MYKSCHPVIKFSLMVTVADEKIVLEFKNITLIALIVILVAFSILELQVTFSSPISFGDEAYHTAMAHYMAKNIDYPQWNAIEGTDVGRDNFGRPPMLHLIESGFFLIFGFNEGIIKFLIPFITLLTSLVIFILTKRLFNEIAAFIAAVVYFTIPSVVTYSVTFFVETLVTFYFALTVLLFIYSVKTGRKKYLYLAGAFFAFAFLTEVSSVVLIMFFMLAILYEISKGHLDTKRYATLAVLFLIFTGGFFIRNFAFYGNPGCYIPFIDKFFDKTGCTLGVTTRDQVFQYQSITGGGGSNDSVYAMGILNYLNFAYGTVWVVTLGVLGGLVVSLSRKDLVNILLILVLVTIIPYFHFTTSRAEDAARNLLAWTPFLSILVGMYFSKIFDFLKSYTKYIAPVILVIIIFMGYSYNFLPKLQTMIQVKQFYPLFFEACDWVKGNLPEDAVISTVWVHRAAYSCERTTVGNLPDIFLSKNITLADKTAKDVGITHLFIQKFSLSNSDISETYRVDVVQFFEDHPEYFDKVYENGPEWGTQELQQCFQSGGCDPGSMIYKLKLL